MSALMEAIDARVNPVWIKEIRQALRGRLFRFGYIITLLIAGVAAILASAEADERVGAAVFLVGYGALSTALLGLVPFMAFFATPSDREARNLDLILLSGLTPGQIARGRLLGAATQAALYFFAFLPFLSLGAVLPGVDLLAGFVALLGVAVWSLGISAAAIGLGLVLKHRLIRALVGLWMSGTLFYAVAGATVAAAGLLERPQTLLEPEAPLVLVAAFAPALVLLMYGLGASSAAMAHPEENRSTPLRLATLVVALGGAAACVAVCEGTGANGAGPLGCLLIAAIGVPLGVFLCEPARLGRRVRATLPGPAQTALLSPFLPGGDRAGLLALGMLGGLGLFTVWLIETYVPSEAPRHMRLLACTLSYGAIYLFLPPLVLGRWTDRPIVRWAATLSIPALCLLGVLAPMLVGILFNDHELKQGRHYLNPFWVVDQNRRFDGFEPSMIGVMLIASLLSTAQLVRGLLGAFEAVRASTITRDARARADAAEG